jgi:ribonuclease R
MSKHVQEKILSHIKSSSYRPQKPRSLAKELELHDEAQYPTFREALRDLMHEGRAVLGARGTVMIPGVQLSNRNEVVGTYRHNKRGFGFVVPSDPQGHEDLFIPQGDNDTALSGDKVRARITSRGQRDGKAMFTGRIIEVIERASKRFVGSLGKLSGDWVVFPDGNTLTEPILVPDAASRHIKVGTKVVVELTSFPGEGPNYGKRSLPEGVITDVLGGAGEKDVDLRSVIIQYNLPEGFAETVRNEAREAVDSFNADSERSRREDLTDEIICTIDPDDAKDYDDAISLTKDDQDRWVLGVHIADVSHFVPEGSALDDEAQQRGNSSYFPGFVIPMLPEVLSNGVCSLQEGVPRLCKSAFITYDEDAKPAKARFANTIIHSRRRLRYTEAQDLIDGKDTIRHGDETKRRGDYPEEVLDLLADMNTLARQLQARRHAQGQLVLNLPDVELVLDDEGKVVDAKPEDTSFTHTLIEMFMVEANEAVARLLDSIDVPFLRRVHPEPDLDDSERLRHFTQICGHRLPRELDRKVLQQLLERIKGKPESFAINLAVLKSLTRAEYSPQRLGHFALASEHYAHFTSPIRRYADLTIHRLLDAYLSSGGSGRQKGGRKKQKVVLNDIPSYDDLVELGKHISYTERRSEDAEKELRQVKILTLLQKHVGEDFQGVVTGITNFGVFVQLAMYQVDGLIRYEDLMDDWWDVDDKGGSVRGQRTGQKITIGDVVVARIAKVDVPRRELDLRIMQITHRGGASSAPPPQHQEQSKKKQHRKGQSRHKDKRRGGEKRNKRRFGKRR